MQITYNSWTKYDLALLFTLLTLIDSRLAELETQNPQLIATPLGAPETVDLIIKYTSLGLQQVYDAAGVPRSARFIVEKDTPEVFWDTLCDVRKAE